MSALIEVRDIDHRKGRGLVTRVPLEKDAEILTVTPDISVLYTPVAGSLCKVCSTSVEASNTCPKCHQFALCSKCSSSELWDAHQQPCEWFCSLPSDVQQGDTDYLRFILEYASRVQNGDTRLLLGVANLCTNEDSQSSAVKNFCRSYSKLITSHFSPRGLLIDEEHLYKVLLQTKSNSIGFPFDASRTLGWSIQEEVCMVNHSCCPNAALRQLPNGTMQLRTIRDVAEGAELFISYVDLDAYEDVSVRTRHLLEQYRFLCACEHCVSQRTKQ
mmetsp:Transcript_49369/g.56868  ORF Transcript_49369/g.56868 Transcript_49369/m.56868 type:complete len:273 (+) Transcript_49369:34-852(+)